MSRNGTPKGRIARQIRCAIYTRKSTEEGLNQEFNSLDAQREAAEAFIRSQQQEGWVCLPEKYDDGGFTGANIDRPAVKRLLNDIGRGRVDCVVVYKVDRLSRSLMDFARMMETFEKFKVSFVSVTQQFNTTHSMGRLTLNILLSFAQFEREIISERTRDKIAAARRKGKWSGGRPPYGYDVTPDSKLVINPEEAERVRVIFALYLEHQSLIKVCQILQSRGWNAKSWTSKGGKQNGGRHFDKITLRYLLMNVTYIGKVRYKDEIHPGEHVGIVDEAIWQKAQQVMKHNGRTGGMHIRNKFGAILRGLLYCKPCGHGMVHSYTVKNGNRCYRYYLCNTAQKKGWHACPSKSLPAEEIEKFVVNQIRTVGRDPAIRAMVLGQARGQQEEELAVWRSELPIVEREIGRIQSEIRDAAAEALGNTQAALRLDELQDRLRVAQSRQAELQEKIECAERAIVTRTEVDTALEAFDPVWDGLTPAEQARILKLLIQRVDYDGTKGKVSVTFRANGVRMPGQDGNEVGFEELQCQTA